MVHWNSAHTAYTFRFYVCLRLRDRDCCSAADSSGSCHAPTPSYFEEMTRCQRQKPHWRWLGNPNGRSKFRKLGLFTFTRSQPTLRRRLPKIDERYVTEVKNIAGMTRIDQNSAYTKIYAYEIKQNVLKNFLLLLQTMPCLTELLTVIKNNFSTTLTCTEKLRYTYCRVIFVDSIYSKTIDIIRNFFLLFFEKIYIYILLYIYILFIIYLYFINF